MRMRVKMVVWLELLSSNVHATSTLTQAAALLHACVSVGVPEQLYHHSCPKMLRKHVPLHLNHNPGDTRSRYHGSRKQIIHI